MTEAFETRLASAIVWLNGDAVRHLTPATRSNIRRWLESDVYAEFWPQLLELIEARDEDELTRLFWERIPFGTGGRRGVMAELGSATINRRTIAESAWGLAQYVLQTRAAAQASPASPRVAIACDTRLRSEEFARLSASVFAAAGFQVFIYHEPRATPQLSFTVRQLQCDCGVMLSASHNPPSDNGFKAYWSNGGQVLPPHDEGIIACVDAAEGIPIADFDAALAQGRVAWVAPEIDGRYVQAVAQLARSSSREIRALYTPLHGVGENSVLKVLREAGFTEVDVFEPQRALDGRFPNVPDHLPNPERTAIFGPATDFAEVAGHDLVLATDPDADRIAVAVRTREGRFACLSGNQLGALLTDFALAHHTGTEGYVLETLVTTPLIAQIARSYRVRIVEDLPVGFKHIGAAMEQLGAANLVFAAEESLGYLAGDYCRDKDASVGALWCLELAAELKAQGKTLLDRLTELQRKHGWHRESQSSYACPGPAGAAKIAAIVHRFRESPPTHLGSARITRIRDYGRQEERTMPEHRVTEQLTVNAGELLFADVVRDHLSGQVALRPSGTEPKIKCYFFVQAPAMMPFRDAELRSLDLLKELESALDEWLDEAA